MLYTVLFIRNLEFHYISLQIGRYAVPIGVDSSVQIMKKKKDILDLMTTPKLSSIEYTPLPRLMRRCSAFKNGYSSEKIGWFINKLKISDQSKSFLLPLLSFTV